ncbi:recombinase family protein [Bacillus altitudinis]|uniref:recombinase family protein n=1 Tax=Bacillus altitudinis TaxID=293387 RepID=UPI0010FF6916|nr:recombinase family protein [Bacillus altitudinis]QCU21011.1 recombinase family protein [Bacillus altitudinis]
MKRNVAVAYIRIGKLEQNHILSSHMTQVEQIYKYCLENNIVLKEIYNDVGESTGGDSKTFYKMMFETLQDKNIDYLIVMSRDRLTRKHSEYVSLSEQLKTHEKSILDVKEMITK